uniref:Neuregulin 1 n=1 Tax=Petromyzon marinus TaxID=7757 RepID=S4RCL7_PETMA
NRPRPLVRCPTDFTGDRCQTSIMASFYRHLGIEFMEAEELYQKRVLTITGICIALLVVGIMCVVAYCKTKKQRQRLQNRLRHGMHGMNANPPNGPHNQPHPPPSPAPAPDNSIQLRNQYIQKNPGPPENRTEQETDCSFSTSHHSTTPTMSPRHNCRQCWGSGHSEGSVTTETRSGALTSTAPSSRETSQRANQRGRLNAAGGPGDTPSRHPAHDYPDSPLSDRYVSAVTTPARSSPVELYFPRHNGHAAADGAQGAAHSPRPPPLPPLGSAAQGSDSPTTRLWRPPNQQHQQQHRGGWGDASRGGSCSSSVPPSPAWFLEEEEYETTQEYEIPPDDYPKRAAAQAAVSVAPVKGLNRVKQSSRRNGSSGSESDEEEEEEESEFEIGENTPFLSIQNPLSAASFANGDGTAVVSPRPFSGHQFSSEEELQARLGNALRRQDPIAV